MSKKKIPLNEEEKIEDTSPNHSPFPTSHKNVTVFQIIYQLFLSNGPLEHHNGLATQKTLYCVFPVEIQLETRQVRVFFAPEEP